MHPHGIFYANEMDGTYKGKFTDPGGFVQKNRTFTYIWEARPGTEGTWLYHDHGPMDPLPVFKGLFGPLVIRKPGEVFPEVEHFLCLPHLGTDDHRAQGDLLLHQRPRLRRQHADARGEGRPAGRLPRLRPRQLLPHLPPARAPLDRTRRPHRRQQNLRPGGLLPARLRRGQPGPLVLPLPRLPAPAHGDERLVRRLLAAGGGGGPDRRRALRAGARAGAGEQHPGRDLRLPLVEPRSPDQPRRESDLGLARPRPRPLGDRDLRQRPAVGLGPRHRRPRPPPRRLLHAPVQPAGRLLLPVQTARLRPRRGGRLRHARRTQTRAPARGRR